MAQYRFAPLYVGSQKVGEIEQVKLTFTSNGEQLFSIDEIAESTGLVSSEGAFDTLIPFGGMSVDLVELNLTQADVSISVEFNGKVYSVPGRIIKSDVTSTAKTGVTKGNFAFRGGKPKPIGF